MTDSSWRAIHWSSYNYNPIQSIFHRAFKDKTDVTGNIDDAFIALQPHNFIVYIKYCAGLGHLSQHSDPDSEHPLQPISMKDVDIHSIIMLVVNCEYCELYLGLRDDNCWRGSRVFLAVSRCLWRWDRHDHDNDLIPLPTQHIYPSLYFLNYIWIWIRNVSSKLSFPCSRFMC